MICPPAFDFYSAILGVVGSISLLGLIVLILFWAWGRAGASAPDVE